MDAMIDIETLDTCPEAVVLSIGMCKFDPFSDYISEPELIKPDLEIQLEVRSVSESTLAWWSKQDAEIRDRTFTADGRVSLEQTFRRMNTYLAGINKIWCQGPQFDMVILENLFKQFDHHCNWQYWQINDSRTLFNLLPSDPRNGIRQDAHDAAADAYYQSMAVQKAMSYLKVSPR